MPAAEVSLLLAAPLPPVRRRAAGADRAGKQRVLELIGPHTSRPAAR